MGVLKGGLWKIFCWCCMHLTPLDGKERKLGTEREIKVHLKLDKQETPTFIVCWETEMLHAGGVFALECTYH